MTKTPVPSQSVTINTLNDLAKFFDGKTWTHYDGEASESLSLTSDAGENLLITRDAVTKELDSCHLIRIEGNDQNTTRETELIAIIKGERLIDGDTDRELRRRHVRILVAAQAAIKGEFFPRPRIT